MALVEIGFLFIVLCLFFRIVMSYIEERMVRAALAAEARQRRQPNLSCRASWLAMFLMTHPLTPITKADGEEDPEGIDTRDRFALGFLAWANALTDYADKETRSYVRRFWICLRHHTESAFWFKHRASQWEEIRDDLLG